MNTEQFLYLPDNRTLAYDHAGNLSSKTAIMFFRGAFGVGDAHPLPPGLKDRDVHYIAPTLPGWGLSSPRPSTIPFHKVIPHDITLLLNHLYPDGTSDPEMKLYIGGGSFGTVPAQILLGAPHHIFPWGEKAKGYLLASGFPAMYKYPSYGTHMSFTNYFAISPWAANAPCKIIPRAISFGLSMRLGTPAKAHKFMDNFFFDKMSEEEKDMLENGQGRSLDEIKTKLGDNVYKSISKGWDGFMDIPIACNEDWELREDVFKTSNSVITRDFPRILVTGSEGDDLAPIAFSKWCAENYENSQLFITPGGHIGGMARMKEIWDKLLSSEW